MGLCQPREAVSFCASRAPSVRCLCDRGKAAYAAYGLADGSLYDVAAGPEVVVAAGVAALQGHTMRPPAASDIWRMMPATFAIDTSGTIRSVHYARHSGDQRRLDAMIATLGGEGIGNRG